MNRKQRKTIKAFGGSRELTITIMLMGWELFYNLYDPVALASEKLRFFTAISLPHDIIHSS